MNCRIGCGACCIAISISSAIPGYPGGKPAGMRCANLSAENVCSLHDRPEYPPVCRNLKPSPEMCGSTFDEAFHYLVMLEQLTKPD
jgi:Fe-S-cluster containining protein